MSGGGYALAFGACICCNANFAFNPATVPSSSAVTGEREPICPACIELINLRRVESGLEPFPVADDAYEPVEVGQL